MRIMAEILQTSSSGEIDEQHMRQASEWARDDAQIYGIHRTQAEVEAEATRLMVQSAAESSQPESGQN